MTTAQGSGIFQRAFKPAVKKRFSGNHFSQTQKTLEKYTRDFKTTPYTQTGGRVTKVTRIKGGTPQTSLSSTRGRSNQQMTHQPCLTSSSTVVCNPHLALFPPPKATGAGTESSPDYKSKSLKEPKQFEPCFIPPT